MAKKIILFLSPLKKDAVSNIYRCPVGEPVDGAQTCEAPLRYLLRTYSDVSKVLCIVTPAGEGTLPVVEKVAVSFSPAPEVDKVYFEDGEDFSAGPLAEIMGKVSAGDEILLELTGGLRYAIMHLLLTSRALSFSGIPTAGAVYSMYNKDMPGEIVDCSNLVRLFDLLGGMQELTSFGSVKTLREYCKNQPGKQPEIKALLNAMERLHDDITLCRTGKIDRRIAAFNEAIDGMESCSDPLMKALVPAFRTKFGKKLDVPGLIRWCISSDMLQQALTLYRERIPGYLLECSILSVRQGAEPPAGKEQWETEDAARFRIQLMTKAMLRDTQRHFRLSDYTMGRNVSFFKLQTILQDYEYIRQLRNMVNHASDGENKEQNYRMEILYNTPMRYKRLDQVQAEDIRRALERGLDHLDKCRERGNADHADAI